MENNTIKLWDPIVRIFHVWIAVVFFANYFFTEEGGDIHQWAGYSAAVWVVLRVLWGFWGKESARWSDFFPTPKRLAQHFSALMNGRPYHRMGHTPIGALVMILMMLGMLGLGVTGYMHEEIDYFWGVSWIQELHEWMANGVLALLVIHVAAALYESYSLKENLPLSMITGKRKPLPEDS